MNKNTPLRVAIYARVSTADKNQDPENQLRPLREYATHRGYVIAEEFVDHASGKTDDRPNYKRLLKAVQSREADIVLVWRYDRFARSTQALINALNEFQSLGVDFISLQEGTDTTTPQGKLVFTIMAGLAEFESSLISDRVRAGMTRAKAEGKRTNRPPVDPKVIEKMRKLRSDGFTITEIQKEVGLSRGVVSKYTKGVS